VWRATGRKTPDSLQPIPRAASGLFIADADGKNERRLAPHSESEYSPSLSLNGAWVVFTSEHMRQAHIHRVHPDGQPRAAH
jgi:Tol biopolymer transport system component